MKSIEDNEGKFWADKIMDLANLVVAVLVFGQLATPKIYLHGLFIGLIIYLLTIYISIKLKTLL